MGTWRAQKKQKICVAGRIVLPRMALKQARFLVEILPKQVDLTANLLAGSNTVAELPSRRVVARSLPREWLSPRPVRHYRSQGDGFLSSGDIVLSPIDGVEVLLPGPTSGG